MGLQNEPGIFKLVVGDPVVWPPGGGNACFRARNGFMWCLSALSYEETCRRHVVSEIFNFAVRVYVMNTLSKWASF